MYWALFCAGCRKPLAKLEFCMSRASRTLLFLASVSLPVSIAKADEGMWTFDAFPAAKMRSGYGWAPDQVTPDAAWWLAQIHPDDLAKVDHSIHAVIEGTGTSWTDEYRFRRAPEYSPCSEHHSLAEHRDRKPSQLDCFRFFIFSPQRRPKLLRSFNP